MTSTTTAGIATTSNGAIHEAPDDMWTTRSVVRNFRKVAIMGLLAGLLAFAASMIVPPSYASGTRMLIRGRDSTLLSSDGTTLGNQPGVLDSQLAAALSETEAGQLATRSMATEIVDRLDLDAPVDESGPVAFAKRNLAAAYLWSRAMITHGFYEREPKRERMIKQVQAGIGAKQVDDSYVLEVAAVWDDPDIAADIANEAADLLVERNTERFTSEASAYRDFLEEQVEQARADKDSLASEVAAYRVEHEILDIDEELLQSTRSVQALRDSIDAAQADVDAAGARVSSLERGLAGVSQTVEVNEAIETGRSTTNRTQSQLNPTFAAAQMELQQARAAQAAASARLDALRSSEAAVVDAGTADFTEVESELRQMLLELQIADQQLVTLAGDLSDARLDAQRPKVELTRLDTAAAPVFPIAPKRYLYLGIGGFVGALAGFVWSYLSVRRRQRLGILTAGGHPVRVSDTIAGDPIVDLREEPVSGNGATVQAEPSPTAPQ